MKLFIRIVSAILTVFLLCSSIPFVVLAKDEELQPTEISIISSECGLDAVTAYTDADGRWYMDVHDIMRYTRSDIRKNDDVYTITHGIRKMELDLSEEKLSENKKSYDIAACEKDGKLLVHAVPLLEYLGAKCSRIENVMAIGMPLYTPWEAMTGCGPENYVNGKDLFGSEKNIQFRLVSNAILKMLDSGASALFTMDYTAILCALQVDLSQYESAFELKAQNDEKQADLYQMLVDKDYALGEVKEILSAASFAKKVFFELDDAKFIEIAEEYQFIEDINVGILLAVVGSVKQALETSKDSFDILETTERYLSKDSQFYENIWYAKNKLKDSTSIIQASLGTQSMYGAAKSLVGEYIKDKGPTTLAKLGLNCTKKIWAMAESSLNIGVLLMKAFEGENSQFKYAQAENNVILLLRLKADMEEAIDSLLTKMQQEHFSDSDKIKDYKELRTFYYRILIALNEQLEAMIVSQWGKENRPEMQRLMQTLKMHSEVYAQRLYMIAISDDAAVIDLEASARKNEWDGLDGVLIPPDEGGSEGNIGSGEEDEDASGKPIDKTELIDNFTYQIENGEVTITGSGPLTTLHVKIPETLEGYPVTKIGSNAFAYQRLRSVSIPKTVKEIEENAFAHSALEHVFLHEGLEVIGDMAFTSCTMLDYMPLPNTLKSLGMGALSYTSLTSVVLPDGIKELADATFAGCSDLHEVTFPKGFSSIGEGAFAGVAMTSITLPDGVTHIGEGAFQECDNLLTVTLPESVGYISESAFYRCSRLVEIVNYSLTIQSVLEKMKNQNPVSSIKSIITDPKDSILSYAENGLVFYREGAEYVMLDYIGEDSRLVIPATFMGKPYTVFNRVFDSNEIIEEVEFEEGVTEIPYMMFFGCRNLKKAVLPNTVTTIGNGAFYWCEKLVLVNIPSSVTTIDASAFVGCIGLNFLKIPENVVSIGESAFQSCHNLYRVELGKGLQEIGYRAFEGCYKLVEVVNHSEIDIYLGKPSISGSVWYYAKEILSDVKDSRIVVENDFVFYNGDEAIHLLGYVGNETMITLPEDFEGKAYRLYQHALTVHPYTKNVIIPISLTYFENGSLNSKWFYLGTEDDWAKVTNMMESYVMIYFYSKEQPESLYAYWCYDKNGNAVTWEDYLFER